MLTHNQLLSEWLWLSLSQVLCSVDKTFLDVSDKFYYTFFGTNMQN